MGSWYETCGITRLPILPGDRVVVLPLVQIGSECHSINSLAEHKRFEPLCTPIRGEYNDYGSITKIDDPSVAMGYISERIKDKYIIIDHKKADDDQIEKDRETNLESFIDTIERMRVITNPKQFPHRENNYLRFSMYHEKIFDKIIAEFGSRKPYGENFTLREHYEAIFDKIVAMTKRLTELESAGELDKEERAKLATEAMEWLDYFDRRDIMLYWRDIIDMGIAGNPNAKRDFIDMVVALNAFHAVRIPLWPSMEGGSQSREYYIADMIADFTKEYVGNQYTDYDDEEIVDMMRETLFIGNSPLREE